MATSIHQNSSVENNNPTLDWGQTSTVGTVNGTDLEVTMPAAPNTTVVNNSSTLQWGQTATIGTVGGTALTLAMPGNPNTNTTYSAGTGLALSGTTFNVSGLFVVKNYTYAYSNLASGGSVNITGSNLGVVNPAGYTVAGLVTVTTGSTNVVPTAINTYNTGSSTVVTLRNVGTGSESHTFGMRILYVPAETITVS